MNSFKTGKLLFFFVSNRLIARESYCPLSFCT